METDLTALLKALCTRTFTDFAPEKTPRPYVTFQFLGGPSLQWIDNTAADKRQTLVQIDVWADTRPASLTLARQIEAAMRASTAFMARPEGEPICEAEPESLLYGTVQDFNVISLR
jgi:Protein of unknown function (DUF3168)